jgi:hypothetical protein
MRDLEIEIGRKTYRIYTLDVGAGPREYIDAFVATGPRGVIVTWYRRPLKPGGPTWRKVMAAARQQGWGQNR